MKKYSDYFSCLSRLFKSTSNRLAATAFFMLAAVSVSFAQDFTFMEGSIHSFNVEEHVGNTFVWSFHDNTFTPMGAETFDFIEGQFEVDVTIQFSDMNRVNAELVYLAVTETNSHGCSTTRAISIELQPNNMYFDFAALPNADDCYNFDENYMAEVQVGMNFNVGVRGTVADEVIPEDRFPLQVRYTVEDKTNNAGVIIDGNGGNYVEIAYSIDNTYILEVSEAKGEIDATVEYELAIVEVVDKYGTQITHDENRRVQIRMMKHLPQPNSMDMAMAYVVTPINYNGSL